MLKFIIQFLSKCSARLNLDILWRLTQLISTEDRRCLTSRLLAQETEQITFKRNGIIWTTPTQDKTIFPNLFSYGHFHGLEIQKILQWMNCNQRITGNKNVIIDIGANIGTTCIPFALQTKCHVLAIEPFPEIFNLCQKNVIQNGLEDRITCVQKAISKQSGFVEMALHADNIGNAQIKRPESGKLGPPNAIYHTANNIQAEPLMNILETNGIAVEKIAFIWSDTEGCEADVIQTGIPLWEAGIPLYIEIMPQMLEIQNNMDPLINILPRYFHRFIKSTDLIQSCEKALAQPITELLKFIDRLIKNKTNTNVLLIPKTFKCHQGY